MFQMKEQEKIPERTLMISNFSDKKFKILMAEYFTIRYIDIYSHTFFIQSFTTLGCFYVLDIINNAAMNTGVHISLQISIFVFFS